MPTKYILNADDYGPIDFINRGVKTLVEQGMINSVQVLVNGDDSEDYAKLNKSLKELRDRIPEGKSLDIGCHLTLTSGRPMYKRNDNNEEASATTWSHMVREIDGRYYFKKYSKFYFRFAEPEHNEKYTTAIKEEFKMQIDTLGSLIDQINQSGDPRKLVFSSVSNHHNIFTSNKTLFEIYVASATYNNHKLAIRSPMVKPAYTASLYNDFVLPFFNSSDKRKHRKMMKKMNKAFCQQQYTGASDLVIKTPSYIDVTFYKGTGSLGIGNVFMSKINDRVKKLKKMLARAKEDNGEDGIVEFVFHLGQGTENLRSNNITNGYIGVSNKYFDNRQVEFHALVKASQGGGFQEIFNNQISWNSCSDITYKAQG